MKIVKVSAMWCPACLIVDKEINKIKLDYPNIEILEYDYDFDCEEIKYYNVGEILPVLIFLDKDSNELTRIVGEKKYQDIEKVIKKYE